MKALALAAVVALASCSTHGTGSGTVGEAFTIKFSQTVEVRGTGLSIDFTGVNGDSRCPQGVTCIWAGRATITIVVSKKGASPSTFRLTIPEPTSASAEYEGYTITLQDLSPHPVQGRTVHPAEYTASLLVGKAP